MGLSFPRDVDWRNPTGASTEFVLLALTCGDVFGIQYLPSTFDALIHVFSEVVLNYYFASHDLRHAREALCCTSICL